MNLAQVETVLIEANKHYRAGTPIMSDKEYDDLLDRLPLNHPLRTQVEPEELTKKKFTHTTPMLSTAKAKTDDEMISWFHRVGEYADSIGKDITDIEVKMTAKLDGLAGILYTSGELVTRGTDGVGNVVTDCFGKGVRNVSNHYGKGELVMLKDYFDNNLSDEFEHPRNVVVGIVMGDEVNSFSQKALDNNAVHFKTYDSLYTVSNNLFQFMLKFREYEKIITEQTEYPIDGVVVEVTDPELKEVMGSTEHHHRWQIALKPKDEIAETVVEHIVWQTGRTGKITPVLEVKPVKLAGATVSRVTAHNYSTVLEQGLGHGAIIEIVRSGAVIPKIHSVITSRPTGSDILIRCPSCGSIELVKSESGKDMYCLNPFCNAQAERRLIHFFKTLGNVDGFGPATISKILDYDASIELLDLFDLDVEDFEDMEFGPKQSRNLYNELQKAISEPVEDWKLLAGMGIPLLGKKASKVLLRDYQIYDLEELEEEDITEIKGFDKKTAYSIISGLGEIAEDLYTINHLFNIKHTVDSIRDNTFSPIVNKHICFTGSMEQSREAYKEEAESLGATVQSTVNSKTDFLVTGNNVGKSKTSKAKQHNTRIITEHEYQNMLKN